MKSAVRSLALIIVAIFLGSLASGMMASLYQPAASILDDEPLLQQASSATSPGHVVFAQYISSDNCGHCSKTGGGSDTHHLLKGNFPDEYVYVTYMSASYGDTDTARAGNVAPYNWPWTTGGAPDAYFGDRTDQRQSGASANYDTYDSLFSSGGGMHSTVNDYGMSAAISQNGANYDITISYKYIGTGTPASNMKLYAALVDEDCTGYSYSSGIPHGYNCWMAWLTAGNTYKAKASGSGTAFHSITVSSTEASQSWSGIPSSVVPGGINKAVVVAALMAGNSVSVGGTSPHVYHAIDSTMGPKMDIGVSGLKITNTQGSSSYMRGDTITLEADVKNTGDLDYTDGGQLEFFYKNGAVTTAIDTVTIPTLNVATGSSYLSGSATFDTTSLPANAWTTTFGARLTGLVGDMGSGNNVAETLVDHDRPPLAKSPQVLGSNVIERGEFLTVLAKGDADDNVDTIDSLTFDVQISPAGQGLWDGSVVSGGENILYRDTPQEGREYIVTPSMTMGSGSYDLRTRTVDGRGQASDWTVSQDGFELANGRPAVIADPVPTVMCDLSTKVSLVGHVVDPETALADLLITSDSENFVAWHAASEEIEVLFPYENGCPLGQKGIEIKVDDGGDYSETGVLPYGTLLFNVIENGQPRWAGLPIQTVDEGGSGILALGEYLSDTDDNGQPVSNAGLTLQIMSNNNPEAIAVELRGSTLGYETVDGDVNGEDIITLRASDGEQYSDQTVTIRINPINDAPRIDMTDIESISLKSNKQMVINLKNRMTDVDSPLEQAFISVTPSEPGAARYNIIDGNMILLFEDVGEQTVTITATDGSATNTYIMTVDVFDALPFYISTTDDGSGHLYVKMQDTYETQTPTATFFFTQSAPNFNVVTLTWSLCNDRDGTCDGFWEYDLDLSRSNLGWTEVMNIPSAYGDGGYARPNGVRIMDYISLSVKAVDASGQEFKTGSAVKWHITDALPAPAEMSDELLNWYVEGLISDLAEAEEALDAGDGDAALLQARVSDLQGKLDIACTDERADCPTEEVQSNGGEESEGMNMNLIFIVLGILIVAALLGLMFMRGGNGSNDEETKWNEGMLPVHDAIANSMFGGAQEIFQQPVPHVASVAPPPLPLPVPMGPPLPPGGLPAGWTMEQWTYYGQQYLDQMNRV